MDSVKTTLARDEDNEDGMVADENLRNLME